jgi:hypothetical protein
LKHVKPSFRPSNGEFHIRCQIYGKLYALHVHDFTYRSHHFGIPTLSPLTPQIHGAAARGDLEGVKAIVLDEESKVKEDILNSKDHAENTVISSTNFFNYGSLFIGLQVQDMLKSYNFW